MWSGLSRLIEKLCARVLLFERPYPFKRARQPTAMTAATHRLASELESMGIELHHPVNKFWEVYGALMGNVFPEMAECAATITPQIMEHGIVTVGGMVSLTVGEMEECIINGGGRAKWAKGVINLLSRSTGCTNPMISQCGWQRLMPPPSAALGHPSLTSVTSSTEVPKRQQAYRPAYPNDKLGERLLRNGTLDTCIIPKERLLAAVTETKDPHINELSYNDCKAVMAEVFAFIFTKYGNVGGCGTLFDALEKQLDVRQGGLFARPHGKTSFREKIVNRFKTGRRAGQTLELDQSQVDDTCVGGKDLMKMGFEVKVKKMLRKWPNSKWDENCENVNDQLMQAYMNDSCDDEEDFDMSSEPGADHLDGKRCVPPISHPLLTDRIGLCRRCS